MSQTPFEYFGLTCPDGGRFYICDGADIEFVGCCTSDPCEGKKGVCPQADLRTSSFNTDSYEDLPGQSCDNDAGPKNWYTCKFNNPPFLGCCADNACANSNCSRKDLVPATLTSDEQNRARFLKPDGGSPTSVAPEDRPKESGLSTGAIAGIAVGAVIVGLVIIGALLWRFCWVPRKRKQQAAAAAASSQEPATRQAWQGQPLSPASHHYDPYNSNQHAGSYYQNGLPSPDVYKYSPQASEFGRPVSMSTWSDSSYNRNAPPQYTGQMAPLQELDSSAAIVAELGSHEPHNYDQHNDERREDERRDGHH